MTAAQATINRMIGRISRYGDVASLLEDMYDLGRDADGPALRVTAGWRAVAELEPPARPDGHHDVRALAALMETPLAALGDRAPGKPAWHCRLRAAPEDRLLSDSEWTQIACDVMDRTGLSPAGQADAAAPWVAIRHGGDGIHIVAVLARQDGTLPLVRNDYYRVGEACRAAEERYGLRPAVRPGSDGARHAGKPPAERTNQ
jgi:hypothetical protein